MKMHRTAFKGTSKEIKRTEIVEETVQKVEPIMKVKVTHPSLRRRSAPNGNIVGVITDRGQYDIFEERDGWGRLSDDTWIMLQFTNKLS